jgi:hypothetical protein
MRRQTLAGMGLARALVVQALKAVGTLLSTEPQATQWGVRAVVRDPDGRAVELYQR